MEGTPRQDPVLFLSCPEEQKLRFQGEKPLRCASRLLPPGSRKVAGPVCAPPVLVPLRWPRRHGNRTGGRPQQQKQRVSATLSRKRKTQEKPAETRCRRCRPLCVLACSRSWGQQPGERSGSWPQAATQPGHLDTRDSRGENEPTLWAAPILVLF